MATVSLSTDSAVSANALRPWKLVFRNWSVRLGGCTLIVIALTSLCAPFLGTIDPTTIHPSQTNALPGESAVLTADDGRSFSHTFWMGADGSGRDVYSRVLFGIWTSLKVGIGVALLSLVFGLMVGLVASYISWVDTVVMRFMDGL